MYNSRRPERVYGCKLNCDEEGSAPFVHPVPGSTSDDDVLPLLGDEDAIIFLGEGLSRDLLDGMYMLCEVLWCGCAACALFSCMVKPAEVKVTQHTRLLACGVLHHDVDTSVNRLCLCINNAIIVCFP